MQNENIPKDIKKINEVTWEIPTSYKEGMNVPARIIATEKLLNQMDKGVFDQVTNVACLPGIVKYAYCMPDAHWGYGSPVGGLAAFDLEKGVISPGIIGFDINCITGDSKIMTSYGSYLYIKDFEDKLNFETKSINFETNKEIDTSPILFMKKLSNDIVKIKTKAGHEITTTKDHPFYTDNGMVEARELTKENLLAINPFDGVIYEEPSSKIILDEDQVKQIVPDRPNVIKELKSRGLLPLKVNSEKLPILAKLVGFLQGDGHITYYYHKKREQNVWSTIVIGKENDLIKIKNDLNLLGYGSSAIKTKKYISSVKEINESVRIIEGSSTQMRINSQTLAILLHALGVPKGNKSYNKIFIPNWVKESPLWIKRLYLSGIFGAELSKPQQYAKEKHNFKEPGFSQNKIKELIPSLKEFLLDIKELLKEFDVKCNKIYFQKGIINKNGDETVKLSLKISSNFENLIKLWGKIGYEYCEERKILSTLSLQYLKLKQHTIKNINQIIENCITLRNNGIQGSKILEYANENGVSVNVIKRRLKGGKAVVRMLNNFPSFNEFVLKYGLKNSGHFVWDEIESIEELNETKEVYDFTINHDNHNFIANNFIISNCGMRSILTNLTFKEVQPKLKLLVDTLFKTVPAGVGAKGFVKATKQQFNEVMEQGSKWCVENDYGWKEDLDRTEGYGKIDWADSSKVSQKAVSRGINQLGTLGSGNHYLEIQRIKEEEIYDKKTAEKFGIFKDQVAVMIHCGSRGMGHQVASDYLQTFDKVMQENNIKIRDRELSCAPFHTKEGQDYYKAMACAANMAFANRQVIMHRVREAFEKVFNKSAEELEMHLVYDVAHNVAKIEEHKVDGKMRKLIVHRKGATRAFPPGHEELAPIFRETGQVVVIGGSMQTGSALLLGTKEGESTFYTSAHGSGRTMSRTQARHEVRGEKLQKEMEAQGIYVRSVSMSGLAEEAGSAYKDLSDVLDSVVKAKIGKLLCVMRPIGNLKG